MCEGGRGEGKGILMYVDDFLIFFLTQELRYKSIRSRPTESTEQYNITIRVLRKGKNSPLHLLIVELSLHRKVGPTGRGPKSQGTWERKH